MSSGLCLALEGLSLKKKSKLGGASPKVSIPYRKFFKNEPLQANLEDLGEHLDVFRPLPCDYYDCHIHIEIAMSMTGHNNMNIIINNHATNNSNIHVNIHVNAGISMKLQYTHLLILMHCFSNTCCEHSEFPQPIQTLIVLTIRVCHAAYPRTQRCAAQKPRTPPPA